MKFFLKKYSSLFLLGIFLFAYSEKSLHDVLHADDPHCNALHEKHFHNVEHHCFICDFDISVFDNSSSFIQPSFLRYSIHADFEPAKDDLFNRNYSTSFTRGPPVVA